MLRDDVSGVQLPAAVTISLMFLFTTSVQYRILRKQKEAAMIRHRFETVVTSIQLVLLGMMVNMLSVEASS